VVRPEITQVGARFKRDLETPAALAINVPTVEIVPDELGQFTTQRTT
jgi:hypothetical protein